MGCYSSAVCNFALRSRGSCSHILANCHIVRNLCLKAAEQRTRHGLLITNGSGNTLHLTDSNPKYFSHYLWTHLSVQDDRA